MVLSERHTDIDPKVMTCKWRGVKHNLLLQAMEKLAPEITIHIWGQPGEADIIHYFDPAEDVELPDKSLLTLSDKSYIHAADQAHKIVDIGLSLHPALERHKDKTYIIPPGIDHMTHVVRKYIEFPGDRPFKAVLRGDPTNTMRLVLETGIPDNTDVILLNSGFEGAGLYNMVCNSEEEMMDALHTADAVIVGDDDTTDGKYLLEAMASKSIVLCPFDKKYGGRVHENFAIDCKEDMSKALKAFSKMDYEAKEKMIRECESVCAEYTWSHTASCLRRIYHIVAR